MNDGAHEQQRLGGEKKRIRARQACVPCRKKKIKCDSTKPECLHCQDAGIPCEYAESKKRGPRKGYVHLLEDRLAQIEKKLLGQDELEVNPDMSPTMATMPFTGNQGKSESDLPPYDIVIELVDLFFKYINSVLPIVHRPTLMKVIENGSVFKPLLFAVMATGARFSKNTQLRTDPPYLAGENFTKAALSLVNVDCLEPTLENLQFWVIMACLEYGRASGSKAWLYGGIAARFCQELGYYKEETLSAPILNRDGTMDTVAMASRRRVFWSCLCIDRMSTASTNRPQCFDQKDCDAQLPSASESLALRDPSFHVTVHEKPIGNDSLLGIVMYHMKLIELFGEVNKRMQRAKPSSTSILWPPIPELNSLNEQLREWQASLPPHFQFTSDNLAYHTEHASANFLNVWLCAQAIWYSSMMVLHRGSLVYSELAVSDFSLPDIYDSVQESIETCSECVRGATFTFRALKDLCGYNVMPYMGYTAYIFATVLMTSTFSKTPKACEQSSSALKVLYELIEKLAPYWPMCERLAQMTKELLVAHGRLYEAQVKEQQQSEIERNGASLPNAYLEHGMLTATPSSGPLASPMSMTSLVTPTQTSTVPLQYYDPSQLSGNMPWMLADMDQQGIDFDSWEFLNNDALFGQVMLDANRPYTDSSAPVTTTTASAGPGVVPNSAGPRFYPFDSRMTPPSLPSMAGNMYTKQ